MKDLATRIEECTRIRKQWNATVKVAFPLTDEMNEYIKGNASSGFADFHGYKLEYQFATKTGETYIKIHTA